MTVAKVQTSKCQVFINPTFLTTLLENHHEIAIHAFSNPVGHRRACPWEPKPADVDKAPPAAEMKMEQGAKPAKAVKPHSHVEEKSGVPQKAPAAVDPNRKNAARDKSKHYHPRDMK